MSYRFGKPRPAPPYTDAGEIDAERVYVTMLTRVKLVVRIPASMAQAGVDLPGDFEPDLRQAVAAQLVGLKSGWSEVDYVAVEQFEDAGG